MHRFLSVPHPWHPWPKHAPPDSPQRAQSFGPKHTEKSRLLRGLLHPPCSLWKKYQASSWFKSAFVFAPFTSFVVQNHPCPSMASVAKGVLVFVSLRLGCSIRSAPSVISASFAVKKIPGFASSPDSPCASCTVTLQNPGVRLEKRRGRPERITASAARREAGETQPSFSGPGESAVPAAPRRQTFRR